MGYKLVYRQYSSLGTDPSAEQTTLRRVGPYTMCRWNPQALK